MQIGRARLAAYLELAISTPIFAKAICASVPRPADGASWNNGNTHPYGYEPALEMVSQIFWITGSACHLGKRGRYHR
jgi:hypothetical protein